MDSVLVVNAGSSSIKLSCLVSKARAPSRARFKGQMDGIGTEPRLRASGADGKALVYRAYDPATISDAPAAMHRRGHGCARSIARHRAPSDTASCMAAPIKAALF